MELYRLGHFAYRLNNEVLVVPPEDSVESLANRLEAQQQQLEDWQKAVNDARSRHYFLNFYTMRELCLLTDLLASADKDWNSVWALLQRVDLSAEEENAKQTIERQLKGDFERSSSPGSESEAKWLHKVGKMLGELFESTPPQGDLLIRSMQNKEQGPIFIAEESCKVLSQVKTYVKNEILSTVYSHRERVPQSEEFLLCSKETTLEEIELLLRRFFHAREHHREDQLYCVGNVHLLPQSTQYDVAISLRKLAERFGFEYAASALVFVIGQRRSMFEGRTRNSRGRTWVSFCSETCGRMPWQ